MAKTKVSGGFNIDKARKQLSRTGDKLINESGWPGDAGPEEYYKNTTEDEELKQQILVADAANAAAAAARTNAFSEIENLFNNEILILNDIVLDKIPTTSISITYTSDIFVSETIRTSSPSVSTNGREDVIVELNLVFPPGEKQAVTLRRLMAEITNHPFVFIYNNKIRQSLPIKDSENTIFALESGVIRSLANQPGSIALDLVFHYFNHRPFSKHFFYNAYLPGNSPRETKPGSANPINPGVTEEEYSETIGTKQALNKGKQVAKILDDQRSRNAPALLPRHSEPWMYYANLLTENMPILNSKYSDYVGFKLDKLIYISPPIQASEGNSIKELVDNHLNIKEVGSEWIVKEEDIAAKMAGLAQMGQDDRLPSSPNREAEAYGYSEGRGESNRTIPPSVSDNFDWYKARKNLVSGGIEPWKSTGSLQPGFHLSEDLQDKTGYVFNYSGASKCNILFFETLHRSAYRVPLIERKRGKGYPGVVSLLKSIISGESKNWCTRLTGKNADEIQSIINSGVPVGLAWRNDAHIVILEEIQNVSYDAAGQVISTRISYYDQHNLGASGFRRFTFAKNGQIEIFSAIKDKNKQPVPFKEGTKIPISEEQELEKAKTRQEKQIQKTKDIAKNKQTPVQETKGPVHKNMKDRVRWIREIEDKHDLTYYLRNKNVRNIFYDTLCLNTSGSKEDHVAGLSLPSIACTAIAVSFGHKLAPIGLVSQKHYSYQFVGSGNKSGQLVFTFAGDAGRRSAEALKNLLSIAKDNATYFGQLLDEAGSLDLVSEDYVHGRQNAILALAGISNVIISNVEERSIPGSSDRYGLVVDFVAREDKIKNELERRFPSPVEAKRKLVRRLLGYLYVEDGKIMTDPKIASSRITGLDQSRRPYLVGGNIPEFKASWEGIHRVKNNVPPWVAEVVIAAKEVCEKANKESPPLKGTDYEYWYEPWGAKKIITGKNGNQFDKEEIKVERKYTDLMAGERAAGSIRAFGQLFDSNEDTTASTSQRATRGITTDITIKNTYRNWSADMERIIRKIKTHISDEANFKKYFGADILNDIHETIAYGTSGCYKDLSLPSYIGTNVSMPPEFYVYDDSDDDSISGSNKYNPDTTKKYLRAVIERELESHKKLSLNSIASNLYISQNFTDIRDKRLGELGLKQYELKEFEDDNLFSSGALAWEPVFHRHGFKDELWETPSVQQWRALVNGKYSVGGQPSIFGFLDEVLKLSSVIQDYNHQTPERQINNAFGDDWNSLSLGPNLKNLYVDAAIKGNAIDKETKAIVDSVTDPDSLRKQASETGQDVTVGYVTATPDGSVTVGNTLEEKAQQRKEASVLTEIGAGLDDLNITPGKTAGTAIVAGSGAMMGFKAGVAGAGVLKGALLGAGLAGKKAALAGAALGPKGAIVLGVAGALAGAVGGAYLAYKSTEDSEKKELAALVSAKDQKTILDKLNNTYQKLMPEVFNKSRTEILTETATAFSLAAKSKDINFRRAFPTFKIYFIEDDTHDSYMADGKIIRAFDDFYSYSAIEEIRVIKSKDIAADLAIIRMANLGSNLFAKRFGDDYATAKMHYEDMPESQHRDLGLEKELQEKQGLYAETDEEDPFDKFVFQTGIKVQIRFGFDDDPDKLTSTFLGQIVEIAPSSDGKMLEIVCQGYGAELESIELGRENTDIFYSSQGALSAAIIQPTIVNFGRQDLNAEYNPGEIRNQLSTAEGRGLIGEIKDIFLNAHKGNYDKHLRKYTFLNYPQDDNIFAPAPSSYVGWQEKFWNNALTYRPIQQTPWNIFKEHELRHPGYISLAVPYGHTARMTMFFGSKGQHYWCKPPSSLEVVMAQSAQEQMTRMRGLVATNKDSANQAIDKVNELAKAMPTMAEAVLRDILGKSAAINVSAEIGRSFGRYVPFRNYHYFDSSYHILANNIKCSSENVANEVEIKYFTSEDAPSQENARAELSNGGSSYKVKLDDNLPEDKIKTYYDEYPSCVTKFMAKRYAQGLFGQILTEAYSGELTVIGDETIKPHDVINIEDKTINMSGPAEVKQVIHVFNRSDGFISIVSPGMCVSVNEGFDVPLLNTITSHQRLIWDVFKNDTSDENSIAAHVAAYKLPSIARFPMFYKLATTEGSPVFIHPMTLAGVPFVPSAIKKTGNLYSSVFGAWSSWWEDLLGAWKRLDVAEELFVARVKIVDTFFRYLTTR